MSKINYIKIIDLMSPTAFSTFCDCVFEELHYNVLSRSDLRKVDVEEKLVSLVKTSITGKDKSLDFYVDEISKYLDNYVACKKGSRAEKYMVKATQLIEEINKKKRVDNDIQDLVKLFITLMRKSAYSKDNEIDNLNFSVSKNDYKFTKSIFTNKYKSKKKVALNLPSQSKENKELCYINTVLYLTEILENEGEFLQEEGQ